MLTLAYILHASSFFSVTVAKNQIKKIANKKRRKKETYTMIKIYNLSVLNEN